MNEDMNMDPTDKEREREVDQWLESALSRYGKTEPRVGLENRVLANLQAERSRIAYRWRWWWWAGTATAMAVAMAIALWMGKSHERHPKSTMGASITGASTTTQGEQARALVQSGSAPRVAHPAGKINLAASRSVQELVVARRPKLEQFPSRRDLSERELLLVRRLNEQSDEEASLEPAAIPEEVDLSIDTLEIRPIQIPEIDISESKTN